MRNKRFVGIMVGILAILAVTFMQGGKAWAQVSDPAQNTIPIHHVIVVFQENRSVDNLFHDKKLIAAGADIATQGLNSKGQIIPLAPVPLASSYDLSHSHPAFLAMYDNGQMDGADQIPVSCAKGIPSCHPPANPQFKYVKPADVAPYFQMAEQFTFADRMFQTNQGPSFPAHQFIIAGTSAPTADSDLFAEGNPYGVPDAEDNTGCMAPAAELVQMIDPSGSVSAQYPCFEHPTLTDLLDDQGISWRYYTPSAGSIWTGPNAISHIRLGADWSNVIMQPTQVFTDITNGQLPAVSWVIPTWDNSDHAGSTISVGPSWVASIVNAVGNSAYWDDTAILIAWDDWGGWYDHVAPTIINSYEYGFRVPLIVVSTYAKPGYISHVTHDFGSILKFTEKVFELPSLGYADSTADDLFDCFEFHHSGRPFQKINAPVDANYFLRNTAPLEGPDDD